MNNSISNENERNNYTLLHAHSEYSNIKIIDSINRFERMVDYAWELNLTGIAMTEHDCLSGTLYALDVYRSKLEKEWKNLYPDEDFPGYEEASKKLNFKVILGNEIYLSEEGASAEKQQTQVLHYWHLILLAKDREGYLQLKKLSSSAWNRAWMQAILRTPTYPSDLFEVVKGGHLICSTACLGGYPAWCWKQMVEAKANEESNNDWMNSYPSSYYLDKLDNHLAAMQNLFGKENFFIELQPNEEGSEQNQYNKFMIERYWGKYPFIFTTDAHYLKADEREIHKAFLNSKSSNDREVDEFYKYAYIMSQAEVKELMVNRSSSSYLTEEMFNEMVDNTKRINDMCQFYTLEQKPKLATVEYEFWNEYEEDLQIFEDVDEETYPNFYWFLHCGENNKPANYLARLVAHGYVNKYKSNWNDDVYFSRLEEEFWTLKQVGDIIEQPMSDYFITMSKIIDICWDNAETIVGPSRGSAGALLINFLLGITQMNPVEMELPFVWRFLHPSRPDLPD